MQTPDNNLKKEGHVTYKKQIKQEKLTTEVMRQNKRTFYGIPFHMSTYPFSRFTYCYIKDSEHVIYHKIKKSNRLFWFHRVQTRHVINIYLVDSYTLWT